MRKYLTTCIAVIVMVSMIVSFAPMSFAEEQVAESDRVYLTKMDFEADDDYTGWKFGASGGWGMSAAALQHDNPSIKGEGGEKKLEIIPPEGNNQDLHKVFTPAPYLREQESVIYEMKVGFGNTINQYAGYFFSIYGTPGNAGSSLINIYYADNSIKFSANNNDNRYLVTANTVYILKMDMNFKTQMVTYSILSESGQLLKSHYTKFNGSGADGIAGSYLRADTNSTFDVHYVHAYISNAEQPSHVQLYKEDFTAPSVNESSGWRQFGSNDTLGADKYQDGKLKIFRRDADENNAPLYVTKTFSPEFKVEGNQDVVYKTKISFENARPRSQYFLRIKGNTDVGSREFVRLNVGKGTEDYEMMNDGYGSIQNESGEKFKFDSQDAEYAIEIRMNMATSKYIIAITKDSEEPFISTECDFAKEGENVITGVKSISEVSFDTKVDDNQDESKAIIMYVDYVSIAELREAEIDLGDTYYFYKEDFDAPITAGPGSGWYRGNGSDGNGDGSPIALLVEEGWLNTVYYEDDDTTRKLTKRFEPALYVEGCSDVTFETRFKTGDALATDDFFTLSGKDAEGNEFPVVEFLYRPDWEVFWYRAIKDDGTHEWKNLTFNKFVDNKEYIMTIKMNFATQKYSFTIVEENNGIIYMLYAANDIDLLKPVPGGGEEIETPEVVSISKLKVHMNKADSAFDYMYVYAPESLVPEQPFDYIIGSLEFTKQAQLVSDFETGDPIQVSMSVTNYLSEDLPVIMVVCALDEYDRLINAELGEVPMDIIRTAATPGVSTFSKTVTISENMEKLRVFVWDAFGNMESYTQDVAEISRKVEQPESPIE